MKYTVILFLLLILLFSGCRTNSDIPPTEGEKIYSSEPVQNSAAFTAVNTVRVVETEWSDSEYWEQVEFPIDLSKIDFQTSFKQISTNEEAIEVGHNLLEVCKRNKVFVSFELHTVIHSTRDNIWQFEYSVERGEQLTLSSVGYIAISGNNCEIIKAWIEE